MKHFMIDGKPQKACALKSIDKFDLEYARDREEFLQIHRRDLARTLFEEIYKSGLIYFDERTTENGIEMTAIASMNKMIERST